MVRGGELLFVVAIGVVAGVWLIAGVLALLHASGLI
jgi:hypothetical protein